jgi:hypothetical protein
MADEQITPPAGFTLDEPKEGEVAPPPGFVLDSASAENTAPKAPPPPMMTPLQRFGTGLNDPFTGGAQLLRNIAPEFIAKPIDRVGAALGMGPPPTNENVEAREADIAATTPTGARTETTLDEQGRAIHQPETGGGGMDPLRFMGEVLSPANLSAPSRALGVANIGRKIGSAAVQGATIGMMQPVTGGTSYGTEKALQAGVGAIGGAAIPPIGAAGKAIYQWATGAKGLAGAADERAVQALLKRIQTDERGGYPTLQGMLDVLNETPGKPMTVPDVAGPNVVSLLGRIARAPGDAKAILAKWANDRDLDAGVRLKGDVNEALGSGSAYYTDEALIAARSAAAKPLFEKAYAGGSLAPLKQQFESAFADAGKAEADAVREVAHAESRITQAAARQSQAGNNVYAVNGANEDMRTAQSQLAFARAELAKAQTTKAMVTDVMRQAQDDLATGKPGAVWTPRIQQFLDNPRVKTGIRRGLRIERDEALAEGRAMNPSEYAIIGTDAQGEPIIGKVPTMRLLAVAKEGLDRMLQSPGMRNELTGKLNKEGVAIDKLRGAFVKELDALNSDYKAARAQWSGASQSIENLRLGQDIFKMEPEAIAEAVKDMTPNDKEFFKLGAASTLRKMIGQTGKAGDETRRLIGTQYARDQLRSMFDTPEQFDKFFKALNAEHMMFSTWSKTYGGSITAERWAEDTSSGKLSGLVSLGASAGHALHGSMPSAIRAFTHAKDKLWPAMNPADAAAQARLMSTMGPEAIDRLKAALAQQKPPTAGMSPYAVVPAAEATSGMVP